MAKQYRFYLIDEGTGVTGTDDLEIALIAKREGIYTVLEPATGEVTFEGDVEMVDEADPADFGDEGIE